MAIIKFICSLIATSNDEYYSSKRAADHRGLTRALLHLPLAQHTSSFILQIHVVAGGGGEPEQGPLG